MAKHHYHVLVGSEGGYMPDSNYYCRTKRGAEALAAGEAAYIMDSGYQMPDKADWYHKSGSARSGLISIDCGRSLDTIIEVTECDEEDCEDSEDGN